MFKEKYFGKKKERRKQYRGAKAVDCSCRNGGSCSYCNDDRNYKNRKKEQSAEDKLKEI